MNSKQILYLSAIMFGVATPLLTVDHNALGIYLAIFFSLILVVYGILKYRTFSISWKTIVFSIIILFLVAIISDCILHPDDFWAGYQEGYNRWHN